MIPNLETARLPHMASSVVSFYHGLSLVQVSDSYYMRMLRFLLGGIDKRLPPSPHSTNNVYKTIAMLQLFLTKRLVVWKLSETST